MTTAIASRTFESAIDLVGHTPMVRLSRFAPGLDLRAKLEYFNPAGSVKDRIAKAMVEDAERRGVLKPGGTIVEPTSGNTGVGLAMVAATKGYAAIFVVPEGYAHLKCRVMQGLGATVVRTDPAKGMKGAIAKAEEIVASRPGAFMPQQFRNPVNPRAHYDTTGPEIEEQCDGKIDAIVIGVGSTGTFIGCARYLGERHPGLLRVAVEPQGSILQGGEPGPHKVEGVGLSFFPEILDRSLIDEAIMVPDDEAFEACRELGRTEGLLVGGSSGAAAAASRKVARRLGPGKTVVTLFPDAAERYPEQGIFE
ncbi:MAG TPA: cysteine synthase family protein [Thermoanaerobaculia bacterium]|nr:cysteine synthase family protein [Thermoanaerobaculia bacterium]